MYIIIDVMGKNAAVLLPSVQKVLTELGENIKLARLRRGLSSELIPERAGISRATLVNVEKVHRQLQWVYICRFLIHWDLKRICC